MKILNTYSEKIIEFLNARHRGDIQMVQIQWQETRKEFDGDFTLLVFPLAGRCKQSPQALSEEIGEFLLENGADVAEYNVVKGFLNVGMTKSFWTSVFHRIAESGSPISQKEKSETILVEFCSPNTNKPLHLGHIRNIVLGDSMYRILKAIGHHAVRTQIINDRGIAICKSMLAWKKWGNGETPDSAGIKGDHLVGKYYVLFNSKLEEEYLDWQSTGEAQDEFANRKDTEKDQETFFQDFQNQYFNLYSPLGRETKEMLRKWEGEDPETRKIWQSLNDWVYGGFEETFNNLGISFDKNYYESETYKYGNQVVDKGLEQKVFYAEDDGGIWVDFADESLGKKILRRADGTSLYITQDLGTAYKRQEDFGLDCMIYVVGNEQEYHFQVLFETLKKLGADFADGLYHLSYGMVELPDGKMKSREGTVVDADDIIALVIDEAKQNSVEKGGLESVDEVRKGEIYRKLGLGALKYFLLKVQSTRNMVFVPGESVDVQGQTGPYIQNAYVRIKSILRKAEGMGLTYEKLNVDVHLSADEILLIKHLLRFDETVQKAGEKYEPALITDFSYRLARDFHKYYHNVVILNEEDDVGKMKLRLHVIKQVAIVLKEAMGLLGIEMPERM